MRTVIVGIDGLDGRQLERYAPSLPTLTALCDRGVEAPLESTLPPSPGCAWPSLYTGADPSHHGVYGAVAYDAYPDEPRPASRIDVRRPALWDYLSSEGAPSVVLDVPVTHPADPIHGVLVPGAVAPGTEPGHPEGIRAELGEPFDESSPDAAPVEALVSSVARRRRAVRRLLERTDWELAVLRVGELAEAIDRLDGAELEALYEAVDRLVDDVREAAGEGTNVVCCSTHGAGPVTGYRIHVNEVLRELGFLESAAGAGPQPPSFEVADAAPQGPLERAAQVGSRLLARIGLDAALERLGSAVRGPVDERVDWYTSLAYCPDGATPGVRINLAGREPYGTVPPSRYETVCAELVSQLSDLETPDGEPAFEFVCRRDHLYEGPFLERAPDVFAIPAGGTHTVSAALPDRRFEPVDTLGPTLEGVFVGAGPGVTGTLDRPRLSVVDVAPIVMALLGRPVPDLMTGSVPDELLVDSVVRARYDDHVYGAAATDPHFDDGDVCSRLEDVDFR